MGTIAKFLFALQDTHNMGISPSGSAGKEGTLEHENECNHDDVPRLLACQGDTQERLERKLIR
jgi:hypothetical protein